jgi:hypothetical protein
MKNKVFTSQGEACQRSKEESLNHKTTQQVRQQGLDLQKLQFLERFLGKKWLVLWYKGPQSVIKLFPET